MIINAKQLRIWKRVIMSMLRYCPGNSPGETEENHEEPVGQLVAGRDSKLGNSRAESTITSPTCYCSADKQKCFIV
jgi:hypothetical protein